MAGGDVQGQDPREAQGFGGGNCNQQPTGCRTKCPLGFFQIAFVIGKRGSYYILTSHKRGAWCYSWCFGVAERVLFCAVPGAIQGCLVCGEGVGDRVVFKVLFCCSGSCLIKNGCPLCSGP